tara:strand:+ start:341 stop:1036 length:696 start_codon:yes stop_codon:yes gene_type:complete
MKETHIKEKLKEIGMPVEELSLGDFDVIGHYTAYKTRSPESSQYKTVGCFFRPNYERGLLIYSLIKKYNLKSYLEIGYGRGYSSMCAAKAFMELGEGKVTTVDPILEQDEINRVGSIFGKEMMDHITFIKATSQDYLPKVNETFDMVYIDGDHTIDAVRNDWEHTKDKYNRFLLFDDYHKKEIQADIECSQVIDEIEDESKELIIMDRRIFLDDRRKTDEEINYGQVLLTK